MVEGGFPDGACKLSENELKVKWLLPERVDLRAFDAKVNENIGQRENLVATFIFWRDW